MTLDEANAVLVLLSAGFARQEWPEATKRLWRLELEAVGAREGLAAARAVVRGHEFLTFAAFFAELAAVREHHHDAHRSDVTGADLTRPALPPVPERFLTPEENKAELAKVRAQLLAMNGPLAKGLGRVLSGAPGRPSKPGAARRVDETHFYPPEPEPHAEPGSFA